REESEDQEIGIAPCGDLTKQSVDLPPDVDFEAKPLDGNPFHHPLQHIAAKNCGDRDPEGVIVEPIAGLGETQAPGDIPEGRMHEIEPMIENITPFAGGECSARELAVDGVEKRHEPSGDKTQAEMALEEKPEGQEHQD